MRVLLMAGGGERRWPDSQALGREMIDALAAVADITVAVHERYGAQFSERQSRAFDVELIESGAVSSGFEKLLGAVSGRPELDEHLQRARPYLYQVAYERQVWTRFERRLTAGEFDLVHRLTPASPYLPSPMASLCPCPFVLGPLVAEVPCPGILRWKLGAEGPRSPARRATWLPYLRSTYRHAVAILASFEHTLSALPEYAHERCIDFPDVGIDLQTSMPPQNRSPRDRLSIITVTDFTQFESLDLAIRAFAQSERLCGHELQLIGEGPERPALQRRVADLALDSVVKFRGPISAEARLARLRQADILLHPSLADARGPIVLEAMASGCVPVVVNHGAPGGLVAHQGCGTAVPVGTEELLVQRFREALERYVEDAALLRRHREMAVDRVREHFSWGAKARKMREVYEWVLGRRSIKPAFGDVAASTPWPLSSPFGGSVHAP